MYALIYDEHDLSKPKKKVLSIHNSRETAETALEKRKQKLGKTVEECNTRIVWVNRKIRADDYLTLADYTTWRPGEKIPPGELYSDTD